MKTHGKDYEDFGARVAERRKMLGLTQQEAAERLGLPQSTYAGYKSGTRKVPMALIKQFAQFCETTADYLLTGKDAEPIAAHFDGAEFTAEERREIENYIRYVKSRRQ